MYDVSQVFDLISSTTQNASKSSVMLPYGPKTTSLAMCLYAISVERAKKRNVPVIYAQPKSYSINYSSGVSREFGVANTKAYSIKINSIYNFEIQ